MFSPHLTCRSGLLTGGRDDVSPAGAAPTWASATDVSTAAIPNRAERRSRSEATWVTELALATDASPFPGLPHRPVRILETAAGRVAASLTHRPQTGQGGDRGVVCRDYPVARAMVGRIARLASLVALVSAVGLVTASASSTAEIPKRFPASGELVVPAARVYARPSLSSRVVRTLRQLRPDLQLQTLLAIEGRFGRDGRLWYRLSLPGRPNGQRGWIRADRMNARPAQNRITVRRGKRARSRCGESPTARCSSAASSLWGRRTRRRRSDAAST